MTSEANKKKLKALLIKGASIPLKAIPLWVSAIGAGVFISNVVQKNPAFGERLGAIDDKVFLFEAKDLKKKLYLHIKDGSIKIVPHITRRPDVAMRGNFDVLTALLLGRVDPDTVFFSRKLEITGDTASAIHFKNILAALE
ncbi:MAG: SCP2 sterol-binding domain-containing protein [Deltaproteobacteria bacterium]|nr:SCP2 sterol-binding domain-containing protein [Deltaproteobacteria bacterium]